MDALDHSRSFVNGKPSPSFFRQLEHRTVFLPLMELLRNVPQSLHHLSGGRGGLKLIQFEVLKSAVLDQTSLPASFFETTPLTSCPREEVEGTGEGEEVIKG